MTSYGVPTGHIFESYPSFMYNHFWLLYQCCAHLGLNYIPSLLCKSSTCLSTRASTSSHLALEMLMGLFSPELDYSGVIMADYPSGLSPLRESGWHLKNVLRGQLNATPIPPQSHCAK